MVSPESKRLDLYTLSERLSFTTAADRIVFRIQLPCEVGREISISKCTSLPHGAFILQFNPSFFRDSREIVQRGILCCFIATMADVERKAPESETETDDAATPTAAAGAKPSFFQRFKSHMKKWWWVYLIVLIVVVLVVVLPM